MTLAKATAGLRSKAIVGVVRQLLVTKGALVAAANKYGKTPLDRAGQALADELRIQATTLGQSLEVQAMPAVAYEELDAKARAKFVAEHSTPRSTQRALAANGVGLTTPALRAPKAVLGRASEHGVRHQQPRGPVRGAAGHAGGGDRGAARPLVGLCHCGQEARDRHRVRRAAARPARRARAAQVRRLPPSRGQLVVDTGTHLGAVAAMRWAAAARVLNHPNLQPLLGAILTPTDVAAVTTLQPLGSLDRLLFDPAVPIEAEQGAPASLEARRAHGSVLPHP